jgi:CRP/FNR family transcriptional regulator, cyclic AMP receptor protein
MTAKQTGSCSFYAAATAGQNELNDNSSFLSQSSEEATALRDLLTACFAAHRTWCISIQSAWKDAVLFCSLCMELVDTRGAHLRGGCILVFGIHRSAPGGEWQIRAGGHREESMPEVAATFDAELFLAEAGLGRSILFFRQGATIFAQGDDCDAVFYIQEGSVKLSVVSTHGKEATISLLNGGDFVGEECISPMPSFRSFSATALTDAHVLRIDRAEMNRVLRDEPVMSSRLVDYLLARTRRVQAALVNQLFNSSEKRLARILLLLAHFGEEGVHQTLVPKISQETLAQMIGCTRSRVSLFLNRFRELGYIEYGERISVNNSLLQIFLDD